MIEYNTLASAIDHFLANPPYYRCLLLVHQEIAQLQSVRQKVIEQHGWSILSLNRLLSQHLLNVAPRRRPLMAPKAFSQIIQENKPGPLLCNEIDLMFEPTLALAPLRLLRESSRQATLIVLWPGTYTDNILAYAVPEHAHYKFWVQPDLCDYCIIAL